LNRSLLELFEQSAARHQATVERTSAARFDSVLSRHLDGPAVGAPLPFPGVSLEGHPVTLRPTPDQLEAAAIGITPVGPAVASYGSVIVPSDQAGAEQISLYPPVHLAVLAASAIVRSLEEALELLARDIRQGLTSAVLTTGPSATADMGAPVYGAHGPSTLRIIVLEDR